MSVDYKKAEEVVKRLLYKGITERLEKVEENNNKFLSPCKEDLLKENSMIVLRRWNSYTPALRTDDETSLGGGYFLSWHGKGIVIDPGFDFIKNFHNIGLTVGCIDVIILTHSHPDHYIDLEPILTLLYEYNELRREEQGQKKVHICASLGVLQKCSGWVELSYTKEMETPICRIYALDSFSAEKGFTLPGVDINIQPTHSKHHEIVARDYGTGLIIDLLDKGEKIARLAFTSDTGWEEDIHDQFKECNLLVAHIGTVAKSELVFDKPIDKRLYHKHLGAIGTSLLLSEKRPDCRLTLISEFGEEFRHSRREIMTTIKKASPSPDECIVADIGTTIRLPEIKLMCEYPTCSEGAELNDVYESNGIVKHYCKKHTPYRNRCVVTLKHKSLYPQTS